MRTYRFLAILSLAVVSALGSYSYAKSPSGTLNGIVLTSKGRPAVSAQVFWQAADGTSPHIVHADAHGRFRVAHLHDGLYDLRAESAGTWSEWEHNLVVRNGGQTDVTLRLLRTTPPSRHVGL